MTNHILISKGYYIGQVRKRGYRLWHTATQECKYAEDALFEISTKMKGMKRGRILFIDASGYYEPHLVMEINRI